MRALLVQVAWATFALAACDGEAEVAVGDVGAPLDGAGMPDGGRARDAAADAGQVADRGVAAPDSTPDASPADGAPEAVDGAPDAASPLPDAALPEPVCGDGVRQEGEACDEPDPECVDCRIPCGYAGGRACGGNTIPGDPSLLYECDGEEFVVIEDCGGPCERMPQGVPDRCPADPDAPPPEVPDRLVEVLSVRPYVEQDCADAEFAGWPHEARRCRYTTGGVSTTVVTATPSPERVAAWIVDSARTIPALAGLEDADPDAWVDGLVLIARAVLGQSSRIFPLSGGIIENLGGGYEIYPFDRGVTQGCSTGCYCRINSLHRTEWCAYEAALGGDEEGCLDRVGRRGLTEAWGDRCLQNHIDAWASDRNEHFRARAWRYARSMAGSCPRADSCRPARVLDALRAAL